MTFGLILKTIFTYLPELIELIKTLAQAGVEKEQQLRIKSRLKAITEGFAMTNRADAARTINDSFRH